MLPHFTKDNTDRNRTSPFAFTGNKFEFRMPGSSLSLSGPNVILNTAVAESLAGFCKVLDGLTGENLDSAIHELLKDTFKKHERIIFNGNGYTDAVSYTHLPETAVRRHSVFEAVEVIFHSLRIHAFLLDLL